MPITDTYIDKDAQINQEIERLRHASTQALLTRKDVIIVASVSCIYGLGSPEEYKKTNLHLKVGDKLSRSELLRKFVGIFYTRTNADLNSGTFRSLGASAEIMPISETYLYRINLCDNQISEIIKIDPVSMKVVESRKEIFIFPAKHFITAPLDRGRAMGDIKSELDERLKHFNKEGKLLEADRLKRRTNYDLAMMREVGYCTGIENYSRHLSGRKAGSAPDTLLSYFCGGPTATFGSTRPDFLTIIDESHVTVSQIRGMYAGDESRKKTLVEHGFRLPSALDNRPLKFPEFEKRVGQVIYTSATPGEYELTCSEGSVVEQIIRPTGLVDPMIDIRPIQELRIKNRESEYKGQIQDLIKEIEHEVNLGVGLPSGGPTPRAKGRVIATTLTKKMAEDLSMYLKERKIKAEYLHSEIKTLERIKILTEFRRGTFDVLVGVNLLREGLDLPEVTLIGILDADKEGFLRSETSLIQTIGRAARNENGRVILYADRMTGSMKRAIDETKRRRDIQLAYNKKHGITPKTIEKNIRDITEELDGDRARAAAILLAVDNAEAHKSVAKIKQIIKEKEKQMSEAVKVLDFESAAILRDEIKLLRKRPKSVK